MISKVASNIIPVAVRLRTPFRVATLAVGSNCRDKLKITWEDGAKSMFPNVWLRASVRDPKYFIDKSFMYPQIEYNAFVAKKQPIIDAKIVGEDIEVQWEDHSSTFNASWLRANDVNISRGFIKNDVVAWDGEAKLPVNYHYQDRLEKSEKWISDIRKYGFVCFDDVPTTIEGIKSVLHPIGRIMQRDHPTDCLEIKLKTEEKAFNIELYSYSSDFHPFHIDASYFGTPPRLSTLLGVEIKAPVQDTINQFVDCVKVAEDFQKEEPEAYELLSTHNLRFARRRTTIVEDCDPNDLNPYQVDEVTERPMITYDKDDKHPMISISNKQLGFNLNSIQNHASAEERATKERLFEAYKLIEKKIYDPKYHQLITIKKGDMVIWNNMRLIHSRSSIHPTTTARTLLLGYVTEKMWRTRMRMMLGQKSGLAEKWLYGCSYEVLEILAQRND